MERLTLKLHKLKEIMDLLTSPAEKLLAAIQTDNIAEFTYGYINGYINGYYV